jgi:hypothetical protein
MESCGRLAIGLGRRSFLPPETFRGDRLLLVSTTEARTEPAGVVMRGPSGNVKLFMRELNPLERLVSLQAARFTVVMLLI